MENNLPKPQTNNGLPVPPSFPKPETALPLPELEIPAHANHGYTVKPSHPHHGFKWLKWLLLFFVITTFILIAALYMLLSNAVIMNNKQSQEQSSTVVVPTTPPQPTVSSIDTSTWQTYTNPQYGFSIKYPSTFVKKELNFDYPSITFNDPSRTVTSEVGTQTESFFYINVSPTSSSLSEYIANKDNNLQQTGSRIINGNSFTIVNNIHGIDIPEYYAIQGNNGIIQIGNSSYGIDPSVFEKILSTFQLATPSPAQSGAQISPVEAIIEGRG